jgi:hypothetical protein
MQSVTRHDFCALVSAKGPQLALYDTAGGGAGFGGRGGEGSGGDGGGGEGLGGDGGLGGGGDKGLIAVTMGRPLFCMNTMKGSGNMLGTTARYVFR